MKRKWMVTGLFLGTLALLVGLGVSTYRTVSAAAPAVAAVSSSTQTFSREAGRGHGSDGMDGEYLAEALGITTDELDTAQQAAYEAGMAQAVDQGLITQEEVDALKSDDGTLPYSHRRSSWLTKNSIDFEALLAEALGISVEQLQEAKLTAQNARIDQAVADGELTEEQALVMKARYALSNNQKFQDSMQSAYEAAVQQAVEDGLITQEQADLLLQEASGFGMHGFGGREMFDSMPGGHGRHGEGGFPSDSSSDQSETP
jgi:hypothetical protein